MRISLILILFFSFLFGKPHARIDLDNGSLYFGDSLITESYRSGALPISDSGEYRFVVEFDSIAAFPAPSLYWGAMYYPCRISLNGVELYRWGTLDRTGGMANYRAEKVTIPPQLLEKHNRITVDFWTDGLTMGIANRWIGRDRDVSLAVDHHNAVNSTGIRVGVALSFLVGILTLITYFIQKRPSSRTLYFSLFAFSTAFTFHIFLFNGSVYDHLIQTKIFRSSTVLMSFFLFLLVTETVKRFQSAKLRWILSIPVLGSIIMILNFDTKFAIEQFVAKEIPFLLAPLLLLSLAAILITLREKKTRVYWLILVNYLLLLWATYNDLSSLHAKMLPSVWLIPYAYLLMSTTIAVVLLRAQLKIYHTHNQTSLEMARLNKTLEMTNHELEEAKRMVEEQSLARESFIRTVAHELRTPLTGLLGGVDIVATDESVPFHLKKPLFYIQGAFHRLFVTVSNLFDFVEMQRTEISIIPHPFSVNDVMDPVINFYRDDALSKGISLITLPQKNVPDELYGDSEHLIQIVDNLIGNAIKFTSKGGVSCEISYEHEKLFVQIKDTGKGIDRDKQDAMFRAFARGEQFSFSQRYEGIGLGLAIADATVRAMKGEITFTSTEGKGTVFTVSVPMLPVHNKKSEFRTKQHILVVEDNAVNSLMMIKQLEKGPFIADPAYNGQDGVEMALKREYDAILMDIQMPVMDGLTAAREIRKHLPFVPIIAVTANGDKSTCINSGMNAILMKPVSSEKLFSVITEQIVQRKSS